MIILCAHWYIKHSKMFHDVHSNCNIFFLNNIMCTLGNTGYIWQQIHFLVNVALLWSLLYCAGCSSQNILCSLVFLVHKGANEICLKFTSFDVQNCALLCTWNILCTKFLMSTPGIFLCAHWYIKHDKMFFMCILDAFYAIKCVLWGAFKTDNNKYSVFLCTLVNTEKLWNNV